ncbi:unnamed protein product [Rotaria sp. Silwood2]|nr:unnamed protein product [Rotaria sp. Silwood2]CAF2955724.1 unnamed protein product [Rotaria sp. Silwood2]CAF4192427.1 unnamed protein product [Rotaria sp. Silwood2]
MTEQTSHKWVSTLINGDYEEFLSDLRGVKQTDSYDDTFSETEADARTFVVQACSQKSGDFKAIDLANFIDEKYYALKGIKKQSRDRSHMESDFHVQHLSASFFERSEDEWKQAVAKYKSLNVDSDVNYLSHTATAGINVEADAYFDNDTILSLGVQLPAKIKLDEIRDIISKHRAFHNVSESHCKFLKIYFILCKLLYCLGYKTSNASHQI